MTRMRSGPSWPKAIEAEVSPISVARGELGTEQHALDNSNRDGAAREGFQVDVDGLPLPLLAPGLNRPRQQPGVLDVQVQRPGSMPIGADLDAQPWRRGEAAFRINTTPRTSSRGYVARTSPSRYVFPRIPGMPSPAPRRRPAAAASRRSSTA